MDRQKTYMALTKEKINDSSKSGRTTRLVDHAIQTLFDDGEVTVYDHSDFSQNPQATMNALDTVLRRLHSEHGKSIAKLGMKVDRKKYRIYFKGGAYAQQ